MKSKIITENTTEKSRYPKMMKLKEYDLVVLFQKAGHGVVLIPGHGWGLGQFHNHWSDKTTPGDWEDFHGTIQLSG